MKLMICISKKQYTNQMIKYLSKKGYRVTKLASTGGFLKQGNDTLLIGVEDESIERLREDMRTSVLELEREKGWSGKEKRFTAFTLKGYNFSPLLTKGN